MRFLIATGIYPPEIGGPAIYARDLTDALRSKGHEVEIGTFGALKKLPTGIRHVALFLRLLPMAKRAQVIIALDTFSAALPALFVAKLFGKPFIVRTGGDFIWEQYVERTGDLLPLPVFYEKHKPFSIKERIYFRITIYILDHATIVFSSNFQKDIWAKPYSLSLEKTHVIENAVAEVLPPIPVMRKNFLAFSRDIKLKNGDNLEKAFELAKKWVPNLELETGLVPYSEMIDKIRSCYAVIVPSISDITPNYILDALRCGKPFILTKYSEYARLYGDRGLLIDPLSVDDMAEKIAALCHERTYEELVGRIADRPITRTYADLADDFIALGKELA